MEIFLHNPKFELFLTYLEGNPLNPKDLKRAVAIKAKACIILTNKHQSLGFFSIKIIFIKLSLLYKKK